MSAKAKLMPPMLLTAPERLSSERPKPRIPSIFGDYLPPTAFLFSPPKSRPLVRLIAFAADPFPQHFLESMQGYDESQRWSQDFGPVVKVDQLVKEVIQNDETKEPFARFQSQGSA